MNENYTNRILVRVLVQSDLFGFFQLTPGIRFPCRFLHGFWIILFSNNQNYKQIYVYVSLCKNKSVFLYFRRNTILKISRFLKSLSLIAGYSNVE